MGVSTNMQLRRKKEEVTRLGVDIGSNIVKIVGVTKNTNGDLTLLGQKEYELQQTVTDTNKKKKQKVKSDNAQIKEFIKQFKKEYNLKMVEMYITTSRGDSYTILKTKVPAQLEDSKIKGAVENDLEVRTDIKTDKHTLKHKVIETDVVKKQKTLEVALMSNKELKSLNNISGITTVLKGVYVPMALFEDVLGELTYAILDFGYGSTKVYVYSKHNLVEYQIIDKGIKNIIDELNKNYEEPLSHANIQEIFQNITIRESESLVKDAISELIKHELIQILEDVKRKIRKIEIQNKIKVERIVPIGGIAETQGLGELINSILDIPIYEESLVEGIPNNQYTVAMLTAMLEDTTFNFVKGKIGVNLDIDAIMVATIVGLVGLQISGFAINKYYISKNQEITETVQEATGTIGQVDNQIANKQSETQGLNQRVRQVTEIESKKKKIVNLMDKIPEYLPNNMAITEMTINGNKTTVKGLAPSYSEIAYFSKNLENKGIPNTIISMEKDLGAPKPGEQIKFIGINRLATKFEMNLDFIIQESNEISDPIDEKPVEQATPDATEYNEAPEPAQEQTPEDETEYNEAPPKEEEVNSKEFLEEPTEEKQE